MFLHTKQQKLLLPCEGLSAGIRLLYRAMFQTADIRQGQNVQLSYTLSALTKVRVLETAMKTAKI